ncbi:MAG: DUF1127 domain-containing protein [Rhodobacteraceae bacterium]|nr:DUF1127 domain-containing protein [Paracoccaceae bacterium]
MAGYLSGWLEKRRQDDEIDALSARDLDEIGLSRGELHRIVDAPADVVVRQGLMAGRFGLTDLDFQFNRHDYAASLAQCGACAAAVECAAFLDDPGAPAAEARFCPNRDIFAALARHAPD